MTLALSAAQTRQLRLRAQGLTAPCHALAPLLAAAGSLQAQDYHAATLGLRARSRGLVAADVQRALETGELCWTWLMRGTLHLVAAADLPWLLPLCGPHFIRQSARRYRQLGLDETTCARATRLLRQALADGPQTRAALKARLTAAGLPAEGQAVPHLLRRAALEGALVCVPGKGGRPDFRLPEPANAAQPAPTAARHGPQDEREDEQQNPDEQQDGHEDEQPDEADAGARLARRFLRAFGPATAADLARWSGLPMRLARAGFDALAGELTPVTVAGRPAWLPAGQREWLDEPPARSLHLLPAFDALLLSHVDRTLILPEAVRRHIHPGGGILRPSLLLDGMVRGRWQLLRSRRELTLRVTPFVALPAQRLPALEAEVADVGRFLERPVRLQLEAVTP